MAGRLQAGHLDGFLASLELLRDRCTLLGRLEALAVLHHDGLLRKQDHASRAATALEAAWETEEFLHRFYQVRSGHVAWPPSQHQATGRLLAGGRLDGAALEAALQQARAAAASAAADAQAMVAATPMLASATRLAAGLVATLGPGGVPAPPLDHAEAPPPGTKVLQGPTHAGLDQAFRPTQSLLQSAVSPFGDTAAQVVPYFWTLALRESLAAELCCLNILEYDGLPLAFYRDMGKQAWDEMRHSTYFFGAAVALLEELESELAAGDPLRADVAAFRATGRGLPVPLERNLYEAILNATLAERLILLHRDTETPGILRIRQKIDSPFCRRHPDLADALGVILRDEVTHAQFGKTWLEFLLPDEQAREDTIVNTELLRGVRLLASFVHHGDKRLLDLLREYSSGAVAPQMQVLAV